MPGTRPGMTTSADRSLSLARDSRADRGLRRRKPRDRHAIGRARDIIEPDVVAERDGGGIAAVLAADADFQTRPRLAAALHADLDELADALAIDRDERIDLEDALGHIGTEEARRVVAADAVGGLRQIVGTEGEELRGLRHLAGHQTGARQLDHGADLVGDPGA